MSDTPRTDEEHSGLLWRIENKLPPNWQPEDAAKWMANFARTLERELNASTQSAKDLAANFRQSEVKRIEAKSVHAKHMVALEKGAK
jgi:hypothetical protein